MLEDKQRKQVRIRCEKRYNVLICHHLISLVVKGIKPKDIIEVMDDDMKPDAIRHWIKEIRKTL